MRIIFYAILFYLVFLLLKVIFGKLVNSYRYKPVNREQRPKSVYTKKDLKNIEDAEFEELK